MVDILVISHSCFVSVNRLIYRKLAALGWSVEIVIPKQMKFGNCIRTSEADSPGDPKIHRLPLLEVHGRFRMYKGLFKLLNLLRPRIVFMDNDHASLLAWMLGDWARFHNSTLIVQTNDNLIKSLWTEIFQRRITSALGILVIKLLSDLGKSNIRHIFAINSDGVKLLSKMGYAERVSLIPLGYDPNLFYSDDQTRLATREQLGLSKITIAYFGRIIPEKGLHLLIQSLAQLKHLEWQFLLDNFKAYDDSYYEHLKILIRENNLESRVVQFDASHKEMPAYINAADIVVVPSLSTPNFKEQYGRVAVEAMACGCLVIASNSGALPEVIGDGGVIIPENNQSSLVNALSKALQDVEFRQNIGNLAAKRAINHLSIHRQRDLMAQLFSQILSPSMSNELT